MRLVDSHDAMRINELRASAYSSAEDFQILDLTPIFWNGGDVRAVVLAIEHAGRVIASMRASLVTDAKTIVQHLDATWPSTLPFQTPVMVLERAATRPEYRRLGLNSLLRYCFLKMAMAEGIRQVAGTVYQSATRLNLMQSLGYRIYQIEEDHDHWSVETDARRLITILDLVQDGDRALARLTRKLKDVGLIAHV